DDPATQRQREYIREVERRNQHRKRLSHKSKAELEMEKREQGFQVHFAGANDKGKVRSRLRRKGQWAQHHQHHQQQPRPGRSQPLRPSTLNVPPGRPSHPIRCSNVLDPSAAVAPEGRGQSQEKG
ncbi:unnamed protein product, partial [Chrysoparadoxa australica]